MKRLTALFLCLIMAFLGVLCTGCERGEVTPSDDGKEWLTVEEIMETYSAGKLKCDRYSLAKYTTPYWTSQIIYNETVCFYEENGVIGEKKVNV